MKGEAMVLRDLTIDLRDRLDQESRGRLRVNEHVLEITPAPQHRPRRLASYKGLLARITNVDSFKDIGKNGPANAALTWDIDAKSPDQGLYDTRFGRDGLISALALRHISMRLLRTTLLDYATFQGVKYNKGTLEAPGKMFHEYWDMSTPRAREILKKYEWPSFPTYFSIDATVLFGIGICVYCTESEEGTSFLSNSYKARDGRKRTMFDALDATLNWVLREMDKNSDLFLEYKLTNPKAHMNPIMSDSRDSMYDEHGNLPNFKSGVVATEVQGQLYELLVRASGLYRRLGYVAKAVKMEEFAATLKRSIFRHLWVHDQERGSYPAAGAHRDLSGKLETLRVVKSIPFFILNSFLFDPRKKDERFMIESAIKRLYDPTLMTIGGPHSAATDSPRYFPGGYHNGAVWLFQTGYIANGLRSLGYYALAHDLEDRVLYCTQATRMDPEYIRGGTNGKVELNDQIVDTFDWDDWAVFEKLGVVSGSPQKSTYYNRRNQPAQKTQLWTLAYRAAIEHRREMGVVIDGSYKRKRIEDVVLS